MAGHARQTGTRDEHYNLISTLYHLLKGASTAEQFIRDAEQAGDPELAQFFRDWQEEQRHLAERAKNLLGTRVAARGDKDTGGTGRGRKRAGEKGASERQPIYGGAKSGGSSSDDIVDEASKESFPASDAPATY
ncbi:hypothetical protein LY474_10385 [Myxococcus stipitatus]|uniref:hypothetical protein n=1 Tax=Myxococcus stipitatus TaxID=83455 RepID=UPI001F220690|nr:hypothetical protein [Myxococcus stipitatus]MCE9668221.1 hypothetical protein [Myxococcus stipitatus]